MMEGLCFGDDRSIKIFEEIMRTVIIDSLLKEKYFTFEDLHAKVNLLRTFNKPFCFKTMTKIKFIEKLVILDKLKERLTYIIWNNDTNMKILLKIIEVENAIPVQLPENKRMFSYDKQREFDNARDINKNYLQELKKMEINEKRKALGFKFKSIPNKNKENKDIMNIINNDNENDDVIDLSLRFRNDNDNNFIGDIKEKEEEKIEKELDKVLNKLDKDLNVKNENENDIDEEYKNKNKNIIKKNAINKDKELLIKKKNPTIKNEIKEKTKNMKGIIKETKKNNINNKNEKINIINNHSSNIENYREGENEGEEEDESFSNFLKSLNKTYKNPNKKKQNKSNNELEFFEKNENGNEVNETLKEKQNSFKKNSNKKNNRSINENNNFNKKENLLLENLSKTFYELKKIIEEKNNQNISSNSTLKENDQNLLNNYLNKNFSNYFNEMKFKENNKNNNNDNDIVNEDIKNFSKLSLHQYNNPKIYEEYDPQGIKVVSTSQSPNENIILKDILKDKDTKDIFDLLRKNPKNKIIMPKEIQSIYEIEKKQMKHITLNKNSKKIKNKIKK